MQVFLIYYQTTLYLDLDINIEQVEVDNELITQYKLTIKEIKFGNIQFYGCMMQLTL